MSYGQTLIVEDDAQYAELLCAIMRLRGWRPKVAKTMSDALAAIKESPVDVALLDLRLPDSNTGDSLDSIETIKSLGTGIVVIITGAPITEPLKMLAKVAGAHAVLSKDRDIPDRLYEVVGSPGALASRTDSGKPGQ